MLILQKPAHIRSLFNNRFDSQLQRAAHSRIHSIAGGWDFAGSAHPGADTLIHRFGGALNLICPDVSVEVFDYKKVYRHASHLN